MLNTIGNECLTLLVDSMGAQMLELNSCYGNQFLWDGNPQYWSGRSFHLFPYVGRLNGNGFLLNGKRYPMDIHGFAWLTEFQVDAQTEKMIRYQFAGNEETKRQYPFDFEFYIQYELSGWELQITYEVVNCSSGIMPFGLGGHPGFKLPFDEESEFSDYYLEFSQVCKPNRIIYSEDCYPIGKEQVLELEQGRILHLRHDMFDEDAIVLKNMAPAVTLKSRKSRKSLTVSYPHMPYLGLWHMPKTDAPYLCIEPWISLSSRKGIVEELLCQSDLIRLEPGEKYINKWRVSIYDENINC